MRPSKRRMEQYQDFIARVKTDYFQAYENEHIRDENVRLLARNVTFQVTDTCNLACSYCYQINKGTRKMSFEIAKKFIDLILSGEKGFSEYVNPKTSPALILEFIGGEPMLEVNLIDKIIEYFQQQALALESPWAEWFMISICSNGVLYQTPDVQKFLDKYKYRLSFSVTLDGTKELHDSCRKFPDGSPSYDLAEYAVKDWISRGNYMGSKLTLAPENLEYVDEAIKHMIRLGYEDIFANCVYEDVWNLDHARLFYKKLISIADYMLEYADDGVYCSLFEENFFRPKKEDDLQNWCGGTGLMLSCDPDGFLYPCIRYMESSLGSDQKPMIIGDVNFGLCQCSEHKQCVECLEKIDRRTQSTDECFYCPIAEGCSWCSAYNYQVFGTADKRATYICDMHKARSLANVYYWNKWYMKKGVDKKMPLNCPKDWALEVISEDEYLSLLDLDK